MKILHSAALLTPAAGILNQMAWEQEAAHELGLDWKSRMFCPKDSVEYGEIICFSEKIAQNSAKGRIRKLINWIVLRWEYHQWLKSLEDSVDIFLLRHYVHDPFQLLFILRCKKPVYLVHHTLEVPELALNESFFGKIRAFLENVIGKYSILKSKATIGVTREIINYEKNRSLQMDKLSLLYPNGIMYSNQTIADKRTEVIELIFVASFFDSWHGLDLLLCAMKKNNDNFILHLVGDVNVSDKKIALEDNRIIFHGKKNHEQIQKIAESCWVGLSSFALYRKNMKEACTLKVREYLMLGLPVYAGYIEVFPENFEFYKCGELNISSILNFCRQIRVVKRDVVAKSARPFVDKKILLIELFNNLKLHR